MENELADKDLVVVVPLILLSPLSSLSNHRLGKRMQGRAPEVAVAADKEPLRRAPEVVVALDKEPLVVHTVDKYDFQSNVPTPPFVRRLP